MPLNALGQWPPNENTLTVNIWLSPPAQLSLGMYDTRSPIEIFTLVTNNSPNDFPGGNLTGSILPPSATRYVFPVIYDVPPLARNESKLFNLTAFQPPEPGIYVVSYDKYLQTKYLANPEWQASGGFSEFYVESASTLIEFWSVITVVTVGVFSVVASITVPALAERRRTRRLNERRKIAAYRLLKGLLTPVESRSRTLAPPQAAPFQQAYLTQHELDRINQIIADYHDVLEDSTAQLWDRTNVSSVTTRKAAGISAPYVMDLRTFAENVHTRYASLIVP